MVRNHRAAVDRVGGTTFDCRFPRDAELLVRTCVLLEFKLQLGTDKLKLELQRLALRQIEKMRRLGRSLFRCSVIAERLQRAGGNSHAHSPPTPFARFNWPPGRP